MAPTGINRPGYSSSPTGINRPGYSSPKPPTGVNRPGYSSSPSPKPSFSAPTGINRPGLSPSQGGGGIDPLQETRQNFFDNRYDVSTDRLQRRRQQDLQDELFREMFTKPVQGSSNLLQMTADAPMSLSDFRMQLANKLGPTPSELMGDARYAFGSMAQGLAEKGTPMMNLAKSLFGGVQNFFGNQIDNAKGFFADQMASQNQFNQQLLSLTPQQRMVYDQLIFQPGMTREVAYAQAVGQPRTMARGGIATLN
jgi:hypothetical protein